MTVCFLVPPPPVLQAQSVVGTPYYMSPECIRGNPYDWSSDTWSLGCLLYEITTLVSPFWQVNAHLAGILVTAYCFAGWAQDSTRYRCRQEEHESR